MLSNMQIFDSQWVLLLTMPNTGIFGMKNAVKNTTKHFALTNIPIFCGVLEAVVTNFWALIVKYSSILHTGC